jgi:hypothetical protein
MFGTKKKLCSLDELRAGKVTKIPCSAINYSAEGQLALLINNKAELERVMQLPEVWVIKGDDGGIKIDLPGVFKRNSLNHADYLKKGGFLLFGGISAQTYYPDFAIEFDTNTGKMYMTKK